MTSARYLIRLDDACETMGHAKWAAIEAVLDRHSIKPIVAVVPDNRDPALVYGKRDGVFWDKVRSWAAKGWTIGMHGYRHVMHPTSSPLLVPFYQRSEFAGLPLAEQAVRVRAAWGLFLAEAVVPEVWVAPAHSFDTVTLEALRMETSIRVVSDGIAYGTYSEYGFDWIPQQVWHLANRRSGLWTVCLHPNGMSDEEIAAFGKGLSDGFGDRTTRFEDVRLSGRRKSLLGRAYHAYFWWRWRNRPKPSA